MAAVRPVLSARRDRKKKMKKAAGNPVRRHRLYSCELRVGKLDSLVAGTTCRRCHQTGRDGRLTNPNLREQSQPVRSATHTRPMEEAARVPRKCGQCRLSAGILIMLTFVKGDAPHCGGVCSWDNTRAGQPDRAGPGRAGRREGGVSTQPRLPPSPSINSPDTRYMCAGQPWMLRPPCGRGRKSCGLRGSARAAPRGRGRKKQKHL